MVVFVFVCAHVFPERAYGAQSQDGVAIATYEGHDNSGKKVAVHVCDACKLWFEESLPGCDIAQVVLEKVSDEKLATDIDSARTATSHAGAPPLQVSAVMTSSMAVQETVLLKSYRQIVEDYGKTPKALKLRAIKWKSQEHTDEVYYFMQDPQAKYKRLVVTSELSDVGARVHMTAQPERRPSQLNMAMRVRRAHTLKRALPGITLQRPPTEEAIRSRAEAITEARAQLSGGKNGEATAPKYEAAGEDDGEEIGTGEGEEE